jgi:ankyrin repeat protein
MALEVLLNRIINRPTVDYENTLGHTALSWASWHGRLTTMALLVERGAGVNRCAISECSST